MMIQANYWVAYMALRLKAKGDLTVELVNVPPTFVNLIQALSSWLGTTLAATVSIYVLWSFQSVSIPWFLSVLSGSSGVCLRRSSSRSGRFRTG